MILPEFTTWAGGIRAAIASVALVGLYKYADRSSLIEKTVRDADDLLARMRGRITSSLDSELSPIFERAESEPTIVTPDSYGERPVNPVGSEAYKQALRAFIDARAGLLVDYGKALKAKTRWCLWSRILSWTVYALAIWEVGCVATLFLSERLFEFKIPDSAAKWSFAPMAALVISFFTCHGFMLCHFDTIQDGKALNHDL